jgi:hypothetical protein
MARDRNHPRCHQVTDDGYLGLAEKVGTEKVEVRQIAFC